MLSYFKGAFLFTIVCLGLAVWLGWETTGSVVGTAGLLWIVIVLSILEVSLSFDNAVVNASVLKEMSPVWRQRFLTWGIAIAVFGMRIVFPLLIVAIAARLGPIEALKLAAGNPAEYERIITSAHVGIAGFGGAFLAMVGLKFFFDRDKDIHWIGLIERRLASLASVHAIEIGVVLLSLYGVSKLLPSEGEALTFIVAGIFGILAHLAVEAVNSLLEPDAHAIAGGAARSGLAGFLYLNLLDSAFSFDGVIGAFALSNNIFVIALGLGIGAMFVRSMTIMLVDKGTLAHYRYLEHGAFWAIIALAVVMLLSARFHIPEVITGVVGAVFIGLSLYGSARYNRRHPSDPVFGTLDDCSPVRPDGSELKS
ncbi:DUF475 domain-containing protein [Allosphingosinicella deserti]|uniref:DUF475 domain-containing protein n=1 Tax=Allosphingosinicella deserti TaxID=2116704 RepID=A0A2P7QKC6_9SPHN|nr:DUF475 domain-containing protein [Sphingomonas deserti]PSJ38429.1 hypothetical protein C7I55_18490 [Sphingomonas deserti]